MTGRRQQLPAQHHEPRGVVRTVLDRSLEHSEPVDVPGRFAGNGRRVVGLAGATGRLGVAGYRHLFHPGQILPQPSLALTQGHRVRIDPLDVVHVAGPRQQELMDPKLHFAADLQVGGKKHIQGGLNRTLPRVFQRHHAKIGMARFDFLKHLIDAGQRQAMRRMAEMLVQRLLRERALRPEKTDLQRFLLGQTGRHDLAEQANQHFVAQRSLVAIDHASQHLRFALGAVVIDRRLQRTLRLADLMRPAGALGDQRLDLLVDAIDASPDFGKRLDRLGPGHRPGWPGRFPGRCRRAGFSHGVVGNPSSRQQGR